MTQILMAVYNGEKYLACQIESILAQTDRDWQLVICDDCSTDGSFAIAAEYARKYVGRISAMRNDRPTGSACANFMGMLGDCTAEYILFSDQDDFWQPDKIRLTRQKMSEMEEKFGNIPLLVHGELEIVDEGLQQTAPKFTDYQGINPRFTGLNRLVCQNNITGCTMMINRPLRDLICRADPAEMLMHDWWAGLCASAFGEIGFVETPLIKYRQHGGNQLGAVNNRNLKAILKITGERLRSKKRISVTYEQAAAFLRCYESLLSPEKKRILEIYTDIPNKNKAGRAAACIRYGFLKQNFITAAGQLIFC